MLWTLWIGFLATLLSSVVPISAQTLYRDPDTGLTFTQYYALYKTDNRGVTFRLAIPEDVPTYTAFDAVVQVVVPNEVGWAGLAWAGSMTQNPLLVFWRGNNNAPTLSSRWATGHFTPQLYSGATYTVFKTGTKSNSTHWQFTALCKGCTQWTSSTGSQRYLSPRGGNRLAFAYSPNRPSNPGSPSSTIGVHEVHAYWNHDFTGAANADFENAVQRLQV